jgi:hypothetical protein
MIILARETMEMKKFWRMAAGAKEKGEKLLITCPGSKATDLPLDLRMILHRAAMDTQLVLPAEFGPVAIPVQEVIQQAKKVHIVSVPLYSLARCYKFTVTVTGGIEILGEPMRNKDIGDI